MHSKSVQKKACSCGSSEVEVVDITVVVSSTVHQRQKYQLALGRHYLLPSVMTGKVLVPNEWLYGTDTANFLGLHRTAVEVMMSQIVCKMLNIE